MYEDYYSNESFGSRLAIKREFQVLTGMQFSEAKFEEFHKDLNNPATTQKYEKALGATTKIDGVNGMKLNNDGSITLRFASGKTMNITELYSSNGEFNLTAKGERASVMTEASSMEEEKLNKLDFTKIGVDSGENVVSLADLGVEFIQKTIFANGKHTFVLNKYDGSTSIVSSLYNVRSVEDMIKFAELSEEEKLRPRFEKEA